MLRLRIHGPPVNPAARSRKRTPVLDESKRLADTHPKCVTVPTLGNIGSKIDVVLLT